MEFKLYCKLYAIPFGILLVGFLLYFLLFDSLNQYRQNYLVTITENQDVQNEELLEQIRMHEELESIKKSANVDFIRNTLSENLSRIHSNANIEFHKTETKKQVQNRTTSFD